MSNDSLRESTELSTASKLSLPFCKNTLMQSQSKRQKIDLTTGSTTHSNKIDKT
jgi:hypothetical protein